jgi:hypothetical protein
MSNRLQSQTWLKFIADISVGYLLLFVLCALFMSNPAPSYFFLSSSEYDAAKRIGIVKWPILEKTVVFFVLCAVYSITKLVLSSPRRNNYFSHLCESVCRFIDDYVWCLYVCLSLGIIFCSGLWGDMTSKITLKNLVSDIFCTSVSISCCLIPTIFLVRILSLGCRAVMKKRVIKSIEQPKQPLQNMCDTHSKTIRGILNDCTLRIRNDFFYHFAIFVLLTSVLFSIEQLYRWYRGYDLVPWI